MNVTLKKLQIVNALCAETTCFTAVICLDGRNIGSVENHGQGGPNNYHWTDEAAGESLWKYAREHYTEFDFEQLDSMMDELLVKADIEKQYRKWCKKGTVFSLKGDKEGDWAILKNLIYTPEVKAQLIKKHGDKLVEILNERFVTA